MAGDNLARKSERFDPPNLRVTPERKFRNNANLRVIDGGGTTDSGNKQNQTVPALRMIEGGKANSAVNKNASASQQANQAENHNPMNYLGGKGQKNGAASKSTKGPVKDKVKNALKKHGLKIVAWASALFVPSLASIGITTLLQGPMAIAHGLEQISQLTQILPDDQSAIRSALNVARSAKLALQAKVASGQAGKFMTNFAMFSKVGIFSGHIAIKALDAMEKANNARLSLNGSGLMIAEYNSLADAQKFLHELSVKSGIPESKLASALTEEPKTGRTTFDASKSSLSPSEQRKANRMTREMHVDKAYPKKGLVGRIIRFFVSRIIGKMTGTLRAFSFMYNVFHGGIAKYHEATNKVLMGVKKTKFGRKVTKFAEDNKEKIAKGAKVGKRIIGAGALIGVAAEAACLLKPSPELLDDSIQDGTLGNASNYYVQLGNFANNLKAGDGVDAREFNLIAEDLLYSESDDNMDGIIQENEKFSAGDSVLASVLEGSIAASSLLDQAGPVIGAIRDIKAGADDLGVGFYRGLSAIPLLSDAVDTICNNSELFWLLISVVAPCIIGSVGVPFTAGTSESVCAGAIASYLGWTAVGIAVGVLIDMFAGEALSALSGNRIDPATFDMLKSLGAKRDAEILGGYVFAGQTMRSMGGIPLEKTVYTGLKKDAQLNARADYLSKPLAERIFDVYDPRSAVVTLAKQFNFKENGFAPQNFLTNLASFTTSAPTIIAKAINPTTNTGLLSTAYAAGGESLDDFMYDNGVLPFGFTADEVEKWQNDDEYGWLENAQLVTELLKDGDYDEEIAKYFGVSIDKNSGEIKILPANPDKNLDNEEAADERSTEMKKNTLYYSVESEMEDAMRLTSEEWFRIRTYIFDYWDLAGQACMMADVGCNVFGYGSGGTGVSVNCRPIPGYDGLCYPEDPGAKVIRGDHSDSKERQSLDISSGEGSNIYAIQAGEVVRYAGAAPDEALSDSSCAAQADGAVNNGAPWVVWVKTGDTTIGYAHFQAGSVTVQVGHQIAAGTLLGKEGRTGCTTGSHLHLDFMPGYIPPFDTWTRNLTL